MALSESQWRASWLEHTRRIPRTVSFQESSEYLRELIRSKLLMYSDAQNKPDRFFEAHRLLVGLESPGFSIRFTVQYNLFAGTILGLGSPEQIKLLDTMQDEGTLGCFALTEKLAGVNSGLVVRTTATYDPKKDAFVVHTADPGAFKNWISQGLTAEKCALIADLRIDGRSYGPHGFLIDLRDAKTKQVLNGVTLGNMGPKTTGNDLDNAWIQFDHVIVPRSALLTRYAEIQNGKYVQKTNQKMRIEIIGQRLLTGRIAIAQASLEFCARLVEGTKSYAATKQCWFPGGDRPLISVPHIADLFKEAEQSLVILKDFCLKVEKALSNVFVRGAIPDANLVEAVAVAKIISVENAISLSFRLKQEVGSYALMGGSGFEHLDFLTCCKFAEGDSRILMQKLARDQVKSLSRFKSLDEIPSRMKREAELCLMLVQAGKDKWDDNYKIVYALSDAIQSRVLEEWTGKRLPSDFANDTLNNNTAARSSL